MKGLSIEQKAKSYDEAFERVKELLSRCRTNRDRRTMVYRVEDIESIFPELAMSEDEKIKEDLIEWINDFPDMIWEGHYKKDVIAWLEKQGEQKPTLPKWKYKNDNTPLLRDSLILNKYGCVAKSPSGAFVNDVWVIDYDELAKLPKEELEKQGEQKQDVNVQINPSEYVNDMGGNGCYLKNTTQTSTWSKKEEKVDNQKCVKSVDDIKPKFKVGDWICNDVCDVHIASIENGMYYFDEGDGLSIVFVDEHYHLWTIEDAMDGDILAGSKDEVILIFRGIGNTEWNDVIDYHCCYDCYRKEFIIQKDLNFWGYVKDNELKPVTKEQRDFLFQKIKEAGYVWDSEKKELRKGE